MGLEGVRGKKLLYHLTKVSNMEDIINYGLLPRRYLLEKGENLAMLRIHKL